MAKAETAATKEQLIELMQYLSKNISVPTVGIGGGYAPIGTIISYMGTTAPQDYLVCDGTTYNIADYKQLSDFFAAQFGSANFFGGDGVTTFAVPDLRGEFLRGTGTNSHANQGSGANVGVHQNATQVGRLATSGNTAIIYKQNADWKGSVNADSIISGTKYLATGNLTPFDMTEQAVEVMIRPTNTSVLYCIKAVAAGDVYSTTERVVGTWIDGKPVYEKCFYGKASDFTYGTQGTNTYVVLDIDTVVDTFIDMHGIIKADDTSSSASEIPLNGTVNADDYTQAWFRNNKHATEASRNTIYIRISNASNTFNNPTVNVIARYTKTTD